LNNFILQVDIVTTGAFIGTIIGAIIGAFAAYLFALMLENRREKIAREKENRRDNIAREKGIEFKKRIASIISQELEAYSAYLEKQLVIFTHVRSNEKKSYSIAFLRDFKTLSQYYIDMNPELKAKVFDIDTSKTLEKVYRFMQLLTPKIEELQSSEEVQPKNFEFEIEALKHDIGIGLKSIRDMKID
jgi:gas vesicle protein